MTKPRQPTPQQVRQLAKITAAAKDPGRSSKGYVTYAATFAKHRLHNTYSNRILLKKMPGILEQMRPPIFVNSNRANGNIDSLPIGQKTVAMGWDVVQQPAVYAIVCKTTGNAYIGQSLRPDLRRAVHYYWLKNYMYYHSSNVYFGNKKLAADVEKYGRDDFVLEIIQSMPGATSDELKAAETAFLTHHGLEKCYNRFIDSTKAHDTTLFSMADEDCEAAFNEWKLAKLDHEYAVMAKRAQVKKKHAALDIINLERKAKKITAKEADVKRRALQQQTEDLRALVAQLETKIETTRKAYCEVVEQTKIKYAKPK